MRAGCVDHEKTGQVFPWIDIAEMPVGFLLAPSPMLFYFDKVGKVAYGIPVLDYEDYSIRSRVKVSGVPDSYEHPSLYMLVPFRSLLRSRCFDRGKTRTVSVRHTDASLRVEVSAH